MATYLMCVCVWMLTSDRAVSVHHNHVYLVHFSIHDSQRPFNHLILLWIRLQEMCLSVRASTCGASIVCVWLPWEWKIISNRIIIASLKGYDCILLIQLFICSTIITIKCIELKFSLKKAIFPFQFVSFFLSFSPLVCIIVTILTLFYALSTWQWSFLSSTNSKSLDKLLGKNWILCKFLWNDQVFSQSKLFSI